MLKKARQTIHGSHQTILSRWYDQEGYGDSLAKRNIGEKEVMLFDRIALERHDFSATRAERLQNAKHWILRLTADGPKMLLRQRPEFAVALKQFLQMQDAHLAGSQHPLRPIRPEHQQRQRQGQQFDGGENLDYYVDGKTGWWYYRAPLGNPPAAASSSTSQWKTHNGKRVGAHGSRISRKSTGV